MAPYPALSLATIHHEKPVIMRANIFILILLLLTPSVVLFPCPLTAADSDPATFLPLSDLAIPQTLGKIQERFKGQNNRTIIQIQDVHAHLTAQENIAAIVDHLRSVCGIKTVALEGAWTATNLSQSLTIPTSREKQLLARSLLGEDLLSGPLYAAVLAPSPMELVGIEDPSLYEQNRELFIRHLSQEPEIHEKLVAYTARLQGEKKTVWPAELSVFGEAYETFSDTADLGKYFPFLTKTAATRKTDFRDLDQIVLVLEIVGLEATTSKERLETEIQSLMRDYKNTSWNFEELLRSGKISSEKYGSYPEIQKFRKLLELRDKVSSVDLTAQVDVLTDRILEKLIKTPEETALWNKIKRLFIAKRILLLKAVPADLKKIENEKSLFETDLEKAGLSAAFTLSIDFYDRVQKRDEIFFDKLMSDPALQGPVSIVTGGFHTDGLSQKLRRAGISYITIMPELGTETPNERLYAMRMQETLAGSQTLSELRNATAWVDQRFVAAYTILLQTKDVRKAVAAFLGNAVPVTAPEKASHLRAAKKVFVQKLAETPISAAPLKESEFMSLARTAQLAAVRGWLEKARNSREQILLVSQASTLKKMLPEKTVPDLVAAIVQNNDTLVLIQDLPLTEVPESLLAPRGMERFDVKDMDTLLNQTPKFQRLAKKHPFAIMKDGYQSDAYIVLPEIPVSLVLYRIVALNPDLYRAAKNPEFLKLLQNLVAEIIGQELPQKAA